MAHVLLERDFLVARGLLALLLEPLANDFESVELRGNFGDVVCHVVLVAGLLGVRSVECWEGKVGV